MYEMCDEGVRVTHGDRQGIFDNDGAGADDLCDAELIDAMEYSVFPNFHPWASYQRVVYRFRPYGVDHEKP